jgi:hypothetical protein
MASSGEVFSVGKQHEGSSSPAIPETVTEGAATTTFPASQQPEPDVWPVLLILLKFFPNTGTATRDNKHAITTKIGINDFFIFFSPDPIIVDQYYHELYCIVK